MMKMLHNFFIIKHIFKNSFVSNGLSNFSTSSNSTLASINSTKLKKGLQPI
jgi:hypothetical protein